MRPAPVTVADHATVANAPTQAPAAVVGLAQAALAGTRAHMANVPIQAQADKIRLFQSRQTHANVPVQAQVEGKIRPVQIHRPVCMSRSRAR
jgi:hypothetical protein